MIVRSQAEFKVKNQFTSYLTYSSIAVLLLAVLYYYRFLFVLILLSYVLGCAACCVLLEPSFIQRVFEKIRLNNVGDILDMQKQEPPKKGCSTCSLKECQRHVDVTPPEPWVGLRIHKQLDQAIEDFYNAIVEQFIGSWYSKVSLQPFFVDELRLRLRYASACLLHRALKVNYPRLITERLLPCALHHAARFARVDALTEDITPRPPAANRAAELRYLRSVTEALAPVLLPESDLRSEVFHVLVREIFAGWVLLSLTDVLADPYVLNTLIILATGDETMAQLPTTPNYNVEFLETFARQSESIYSQRCKLLRLDLEQVLDDQEMFYAFMQFLKTTSHIHLLQFYKDIKSFQTKLLNPLLCEKEREHIMKEAEDIFVTYFDTNSSSNINLDKKLVDEMKSLLTCTSEDSIRRLQTSKALYQAARQSHAALEKVMLPRFLHSEEFYKLVIGSRTPTGYHKQMTKKPDKLPPPHRPKPANQAQSASDSDSVDLLQYLDCLLTDSADSQDSRNLADCRAALADAQIVQQAPPRRGTVRVFTLAVNLAPPAQPPSFLSPKRTEHDFHLLNSKLEEFHGHVAPRPLPSRRDNSPLETLRYKYEDYLQQLLQMPLLQTSELLHLFLTVEGDFSMAVQALSLGGSGPDLINMYQSVAHRLKKEKGQHLEGFMKNYLLSSDMERYQALKQNNAQVEEAIEAGDDVTPNPLRHRVTSRDIRNDIFGDNFGKEPTVVEGGRRGGVKGGAQCLLFLLHKVIHARSILTAVIGALISVSKDMIDSIINRLLDSQLRALLSERRLAHLIRLGHGLLFGKAASEPRGDASLRREAARAQLLASVPRAVTMATGPGLKDAVGRTFDLIQSPQHNKQLVYELLDLCLSELFPELCEANIKGDR